jgi:hypothetical protein
MSLITNLSVVSVWKAFAFMATVANLDLDGIDRLRLPRIWFTSTSFSGVTERREITACSALLLDVHLE